MPETFDHALLAAIVQYHLGQGCVPSFTPIRTGKHNTSFWVNTARERLVLRLAPADDVGVLFYERRMMRQEPALHALIRARTTVPVAEIVAHDFSRARIDRDYVLMRALPGMPLSDVPRPTSHMVDRTLMEVGAHLRQLHALTATDCLGATAYGYLGEHRPMEPQPSWFAAFRIMWRLLLNDVVACGAYSKREAAALVDLLDRAEPHFRHPVEPRLLHMDVWHQNILVAADGTVTGLVDLDRALWGDSEIEFAVLDYCGISTPAFWRGYGMGCDDSPSARIRQQFYMLYEVQKYMPIRIWRGNDPARAAQYRQQSLALAARLARDLSR